MRFSLSSSLTLSTLLLLTTPAHTLSSALAPLDCSHILPSCSPGSIALRNVACRCSLAAPCDYWLCPNDGTRGVRLSHPLLCPPVAFSPPATNSNAQMVCGARATGCVYV